MTFNEASELYLHAFGEPDQSFDFNMTNKTYKQWYWYWISCNRNITMEMINANPDLPWDWSGISRNPNLTVEMIKANPDKPWQWYWLSRTNINVTKEINCWLDKLR